MREIVRIKNAFKYFQENKFWIISVLYLLSIIKEVIWYSMFGINILNFITIQDTFISFFNHTIIFIILYLNYLSLSLYSSNFKINTFLRIFLLIFFLISSFAYFQILKKPFSLIFIIFIVYSIVTDLKKRKYLKTLTLILALLIMFSTLEPLIQAFDIKKSLNSERRRRGFEFLWDETNMDYYSFTYENKKIDTKQKKYFLIGNNRDYFFVFDQSIKKSLIIPKSECKKITAEFKFF